MKLINLDDRRVGWLSAKSLCLVCFHQWQAVFHYGTDDSLLECPSCKAQESFTVPNIDLSSIEVPK